MTRTKMLKAQRAKVEAAFPDLMRRLGFTPGDDFDRWHRWSERFKCDLRVTLIASADYCSWPWIGCRFNREPLYHPWEQDDPRNRLYADIDRALCGGCNVYTGKTNCHTWDVPDAATALREFEDHLTRLVFVPAGMAGVA